jgi:SM-20-related protein
MEPKYTYAIGGRSLYVFDDVIPNDEVKQINARFASGAFIRDELDGPERAHVRTFNADTEWSSFDGLEFQQVVTEAVSGLFPDRELELQRVHCNLTVFGDAGFPHRDCRPDRDDVTALFFVNAEWDREWGGEITFYNEHGDAVNVVTPRPGRMAVFEGAIEHRVGVPNRNCYDARLSVACKFKGPGESW